MKDFDFEGFKKMLKEKTIESFIEYKQEKGIDDLCGFAFYTDSSFMSLSVFINLRSELSKKPEPKDYYRFTVDEWTDKGYPNEKLTPVSAILNEANDSDLDDLDSFYLDMDYISGLCNTFVDVISEMKAENLFEGVKEDFIWNVGISDFDDPPVFIQIFQELNTLPLAQEFEQYLIKEYKKYPSEQWSYKKGQWKSKY